MRRSINGLHRKATKIRWIQLCHDSGQIEQVSVFIHTKKLFTAQSAPEISTREVIGHPGVPENHKMFIGTFWKE